MGRFCKDDHLVYTGPLPSPPLTHPLSPPPADDLRLHALRGHYETVVRIMNHWSSPSPNDICHNGETPFYALLMHLLTQVPLSLPFSHLPLLSFSAHAA
jgi:hypothetical protein